MEHAVLGVRTALGAVPVAILVNPSDEPLYSAVRSQFHEDGALMITPGGATRQRSVLKGLQALARLTPPPTIVLIHDCARPLASRDLFRRAVESAREFGAAVPALPVTDAIKRIGSGVQIIGEVDRGELRAVQTPQAFSLTMILDAHRRAAEAGIDDLPDDSAVAAYAGQDVRIFPGEHDNIKLTVAEDFARAEALMGEKEVRVGQGFDVHAFGPGDHVWLGGMRIAHGRGLVGHSDADVLLHAVTDALYGALAEGDIGAHFPPSDPRWRGASSGIFLAHAAERVRARGGTILHLDATIVCENPKIGPHRDAIRAHMAELLGLAIDQVAVKATTSEGLGFTGRGEGIAAMALATIQLQGTRQ